jgi:hypothetical protein
MQANTEQAWRAGYLLGIQQETYSREWQCPRDYLPAECWAMVRGFDAAWNMRRHRNNEMAMRNI